MFPPLVVPQLDDISGEQHGELADALVDAFKDEDGLKVMVTRKLDRQLNTIAGGKNFSEIAFNLVDWAARSGYLQELVQGALDMQPRNPKLRAFALSLTTKNRNAPMRPRRVHLQIKGTVNVENFNFKVIGGAQTVAETFLVDKVMLFDASTHATAYNFREFVGEEGGDMVLAEIAIPFEYDARVLCLTAKQGSTRYYEGTKWTATLSIAPPMIWHGLVQAARRSSISTGRLSESTLRMCLISPPIAATGAPDRSTLQPPSATGAHRPQIAS